MAFFNNNKYYIFHRHRVVLEFECTLLKIECRFAFSMLFGLCLIDMYPTSLFIRIRENIHRIWNHFHILKNQWLFPSTQKYHSTNIIFSFLFKMCQIYYIVFMSMIVSVSFLFICLVDVCNLHYNMNKFDLEIGY